MRKVISLFLIVVLISGCNRMSDNVRPAPQSSNVPAPAPQSSNAPVPELQPTPAPTADANPDLDPVEEICGSKKNVDPYFFHALFSFVLNAYFCLLSLSYPSSYFLTILRMLSSFSFPVHAYLTNPSFLSKSKLSLTALAVDTCLSLYGLITKNPLTDTHLFLEAFRIFAYPHILAAYSYGFHLLKSAIWK